MELLASFACSDYKKIVGGLDACWKAGVLFLSPCCPGPIQGVEVRLDQTFCAAVRGSDKLACNTDQAPSSIRWLAV